MKAQPGTTAKTSASSIHVFPCKAEGQAQIPGSKSHSIRALLLAGLARGKSTIQNILFSQDTRSCINVLKAWGVDFEETTKDITVYSKGLSELSFYTEKEGSNEVLRINVGNSGTTLYLATAIAALGNRKLEFDGDTSIRNRSARELLQALQERGAKIEHSGNYCAPYTVQGPVQGGNVSIDCPTSQYLSGLLIALSLTENSSNIRARLLGEFPYVAMTVQWLKMRNIHITHDDDYKNFTVPARGSIDPFTAAITGDYSSAAFFICAAAILNARIEILGLDPEDIQADRELIAVLETMGAHFEWEQAKNKLWLLRVNSRNGLSGGTFNLRNIPDSLPILAVTACYARTPVTLTGIAHARIKESDRIAVMARELGKIGVRCQEFDDGITIYPDAIQGGSVDSHGDHRIAMALAIAALGSQKGITIKNHTVTDITFPHFFEILGSLGVRTEVFN